MDSTRNMDANWRAAADFLKTRSPTGQNFAAPYPFRHFLKAIVPLHEIAGQEPGKLNGLVLHKGFYQEVDPSFLHHMLEQAVPVFANAVFVILDRTGPALKASHKHLRLLPGIRAWAAQNAAPAAQNTPAAPEDDSNWQDVIAHIKERGRQGGVYAVPDFLLPSLDNAISLDEAAKQSPEALAGLVLHKGLYQKIAPAFLAQILARAKPSLANAVFILFEADGTPLPRRHPHLAGLPQISKWARARAHADLRAIDGQDPARAEASDAAMLDAMARFIADFMCRAVNPAAAEPVIAVAETVEPFDDSEWFWVDDTGKTAELFALPRIRDAYPALADAMLDYVLRLSPGALIHRRAARPELKLVQSDPRKFAATNNFFSLTGDLSKGIVCPSIRYNDDRSRVNAQYGAGLIRFREGGRVHAVSLASAITDYRIAEEADRLVFSHTSAIAGSSWFGKGAHACDVTCRYTLWRSRPTMEVSVTVTPAPGKRLEDVQIVTVFDQINPERGFKTAIIGGAGGYESFSAPVSSQQHPSKARKEKLHQGQAEYLCLYESGWMPGFANGLHLALRNPGLLREISAQGSRQGNFHWVGATYDLGVIESGTTRTVCEDRLLTGGGYYQKADIYKALMDTPGDGEIDPSVSYDVGAELNAVAVFLWFASRSAYAAAPSADRLAALKHWYDRHLEIYLQILRPDEEGGGERLFFRGLSFVILSLDCMARSYPEEAYGEKLKTCVRFLLRQEQPVLFGMEESLFGWPELDCQVSVLLALARAAWWGDEKGEISAAIRRGLRAIALAAAQSDPAGKVKFLHDTLLVRNESGDQDTGYWNFKLGLAVRAFYAIARMQDLGRLQLDQETLNHMELLDTAARLLLKQSMLWDEGRIEILTSQKATETNSETQPWVALGLVPAIERAILA